MVRHVLAHNGGREQAIVDHLATLLRPGGCVYLVDAYAGGMTTEPDLPVLAEINERYRAFHALRGNDLRTGLHLGEWLRAAGLELVDFRGTYQIVTFPPGLRPPALAAREAMLAAGVVTRPTSAGGSASCPRWTRSRTGRPASCRSSPRSAARPPVADRSGRRSLAGRSVAGRSLASRSLASRSSCRPPGQAVLLAGSGCRPLGQAVELGGQAAGCSVRRSSDVLGDGQARGGRGRGRVADGDDRAEPADPEVVDQRAVRVDGLRPHPGRRGHHVAGRSAGTYSRARATYVRFENDPRSSNTPARQCVRNSRRAPGERSTAASSAGTTSRRR